MIELAYLTLSNYIVGNLNLILGLLFAGIIFRVFKLKINYISSDTDNVNAQRLIKYIKDDNTHTQYNYIHDGDGHPNGYCINRTKRFIAYVTYSATDNKKGDSLSSFIYFIGKLPDDIKKNPIEVKKEKEPSIELYLSGIYYGDIPRSIHLPFAGFEPRESQLRIINEIMDTYHENKFNICRTLIYGEPGMGKSFIAKLLAKELDAKCCFDLKLDEPGNPIYKLYKTAQPTKDEPLIIQVDEFDILINKVHKEKINNSHQWLRTMIHNKQTFNTFLSEYLICLPYVIYVFTMNSHPDDINKLDESYIRSNRIDLLIEL